MSILFFIRIDLQWVNFGTIKLWNCNRLKEVILGPQDPDSS